MEAYSLEDSLKNFGIKIKSEADLMDDFYDEGDDSDDEQELIYSYARPRSSSSYIPSVNHPYSSSYSGQSYIQSSTASGSHSNRKRKQELSTMDRDDSMPEEVTFPEPNSEQSFNNGMDLHLLSKRKDKPPLYLLNPEDFTHDPMKQYQIRRAIITYRHHQEKKELIRQLKDENSKLHAVVQKYKKREDAILKACNCNTVMEIILSSNPEDILQLPPPVPRPVPNIPPLPRTKRQEKFHTDEVIKAHIEPQDMYNTYANPEMKKTRSTPTVMTTQKKNTPGIVPKTYKNGNKSSGATLTASTLVKATYSKSPPEPVEAVEQKQKPIGQVTLDQIHRIVNFHKQRQINKLNSSVEEDDLIVQSQNKDKQNGAKKSLNLMPKLTPSNAVLSKNSQSSNAKINTTKPSLTTGKNIIISNGNKKSPIPGTSVISHQQAPKLQQQGIQRPILKPKFTPVKIKQEKIDTEDQEIVDDISPILIPEVSMNEQETKQPIAQQSVAAHLMAPRKDVLPKIKEEPKDVDPNQRRSKRTSAIFRPNAADMLKGIIRKVGTKPELGGGDDDEDDLVYARPGKMVRTK